MTSTKPLTLSITENEYETGNSNIEIETTSKPKKRDSYKSVNIWKYICILITVCTVVAIVMVHIQLTTSINSSIMSQEEAVLVMEELMDLNVSYDRFDSQQKSNYIQAFNVFDEDHDEYLNEAEFSCYFELSLDKSRMFERIDINADGIMSYRECVAYLYEINKIREVHMDFVTKVTRQMIMKYSIEIERDDDLLFVEYAALCMYFEPFDIYHNGYILKTDYLSISAHNKFIAIDNDKDDRINCTELSNVLYGDASNDILRDIFGDNFKDVMVSLQYIQTTPETVSNITHKLQLSPFDIKQMTSNLDNKDINKEHICFRNEYCYYTYIGIDAKDTKHIYYSPIEHTSIENIFITNMDNYMNQLNNEEIDRVKDAERICNRDNCCREDDDTYDTSSECITYGYIQCISSQNKCIWDCTLPKNNTIKRVFKGIDRHNAVAMDHPQTTKDKEDALMNMDDMDLSGNVMDACGTVYEYTLTEHWNSKDALHHDEIRSQEADEHRRLRAITQSGDMGDTLRRKLGVMGTDGRWDISSWQAPYYKNVLLLYYTNDGVHRCSGSLISPIHVLTAGHCVSDCAGNFYWGFTVYPSYGAGNTETYFTYSKVWVFNAWHRGCNWDWDIAVITLDTTDTGYGWFSFGYNDALASSDWFGVNGYPSDKGYVLQHQWVQMDEDILDNLFRTKTGDIVGGNSGGPAWLYETNVVYGVVSHETYSSFSPRVYYHNAFTRITQAKHKAICTYLSGFEETETHC